MIVAVDGQPLTRSDDLADEISAMSAGDEVELEVRARRKAPDDPEFGWESARAVRVEGRPGRVQTVSEAAQASDSRDVSLTIPARPDYLVLARLALSAVCRLTPLSPEEIADLKLAITEAANDYVDDARPLDDETRLSFGFHLLDDRLVDGARGARQRRLRRWSRS